MKASVFLSNSTLRAVEGRAALGGVRVAACFTAAVPDQLRQGGVAGQEELLADYLATVWQQFGLSRKNVTLVLDTDRAIVKPMLVPALKGDQMAKLIENEMSQMVLADVEYLFDYTLVDSHSASNEILAAAAERPLIQAYANAFAAAGIRLSCIDLALPCATRLLGRYRGFRRLNYIVAVADGNTVATLLFLDGRYRFFNTTTLFAERGTQAASAELARAVSSMVQFNTAQRTEREVQAAFLCGLSQEELAYCDEMAGFLSLPVSPLPHLRGAVKLGWGVGSPYCCADYLYALGGLLRK